MEFYYLLMAIAAVVTAIADLIRAWQGR